MVHPVGIPAIIAAATATVLDRATVRATVSATKPTRAAMKGSEAVARNRKMTRMAAVRLRPLPLPSESGLLATHRIYQVH